MTETTIQLPIERENRLIRVPKDVDGRFLSEHGQRIADRHAKENGLLAGTVRVAQASGRDPFEIEDGFTRYVMRWITIPNRLAISRADIDRFGEMTSAINFRR